VLLGDRLDDDRLAAAERSPDDHLVALAQQAMRLRRLAVDRNLPVSDGLLCFRSRAEQARDIQPDIETC
jgi:hypothetical protein